MPKPTTCRTCGGPVAKTASKCEQCGDRMATRRMAIDKTLHAIAIIGAVVFCYVMLTVWPS